MGDMDKHSGETTAKQWDVFSAEYPEKVFTLLQFPEMRRRVIAATKPCKILDIGCGPVSALLNEFAETGCDVTATDISVEMLKANRNGAARKDVRFAVADHRSLPFEDSSFDTIVSVNSILPEERTDIDRTASEVMRVLKPDGRFIAFFPAFETSLIARDYWGMDIRIDLVNRREFDTTGWQCFQTRNDVEELLSRHGFIRHQIESVTFDSDEAIEAIRKVYGSNLSRTVLQQYPLFEYFVTAYKRQF